MVKHMTVQDKRDWNPPRYRTRIRKFAKLLIMRKISIGATAIAA
jgi:hypothetical protein